MANDIKKIYKSEGFLIGFIKDENFYTQFGQYLGWKDNDYIWDYRGQFKGKLFEKNGNYYIWKSLFELAPIPQYPKIVDDLPRSEIPEMKATVDPVNVEFGYVDAF